MNLRPQTAALIAMVLFAEVSRAVPPAPANDSCGLGKITWPEELQSVLSRRAVEAIRLAQRTDTASAAKLRKLVSESAEVDLGVGDVARSLGTGLTGLQMLAQAMQADAFRFEIGMWIPGPVQNPCGPHEVTVEFSARNGTKTYPLKFSFVDGVIVSAKGWTTTYEAGPMN